MRNNIIKRRRFRGERYDPLMDIEQEQGIELPGKFHDLSQPPTDFLKKKRGKEKEGYGRLHI